MSTRLMLLTDRILQLFRDMYIARSQSLKLTVERCKIFPFKNIHYILINKKEYIVCIVSQCLNRMNIYSHFIRFDLWFHNKHVWNVDFTIEITIFGTNCGRQYSNTIFSLLIYVLGWKYNVFGCKTSYFYVICIEFDRRVGNCICFFSLDFEL